MSVLCVSVHKRDMLLKRIEITNACIAQMRAFLWNPVFACMCHIVKNTVFTRESIDREKVSIIWKQLKNTYGDIPNYEKDAILHLYIERLRRCHSIVIQSKSTHRYALDVVDKLRSVDESSESVRESVKFFDIEHDVGNRKTARLRERFDIIHNDFCVQTMRFVEMIRRLRNTFEVCNRFIMMSIIEDDDEYGGGYTLCDQALCDFSVQCLLASDECYTRARKLSKSFHIVT